MITADIKQLAKDYEMADVDKRFYYRSINGFIVSAFAEEKKRVLIINAYLTQEAYEQHKEEIDNLIHTTDKDNRLLCHSYNNGEFIFEFKRRADSYFHMSNIIKELTPKLKQIGALGIGYCTYCHKPLIKGDRQLIEFDSSAKTVHHECEKTLKEKYKKKTPERNLIIPSVGKGITISIIAAIITSFMWAVLSSVDFTPYIVCLAGLPIGYITKTMYDYGGGKEGLAKMIIIPCANALSIFMGGILSFFPKYIGMLRAGETSKVGFSKLCSLAFENVINSKMLFLIGFALSLIICYDVFIKLGKITVEIDAKDCIKHIRSY